jgi:metallo-beta-lactamase family protein
MRVQFLGAAQTVTGSCFLVHTEKSRFLVDCGMFQGSKSIKEYNYGEFGFNISDLDFVILTHAHVDHCGLLPKLYKKGFNGPTYSTKTTKELCGVVLPDSGYIQESEVERKNRKLARRGEPLLEPIYTAQDAENCLSNIIGYKYNEFIQVAEDVKIRFQDSGHILGAAMVEVFVWEKGKETKIVFSGDIGNLNQAIIKDPTIIPEADYVVMESTYGNRYHINADNRIDLLIEAVNKTMAKGGNLIIPSFAVERTQDMVYTLKKLKDEGKIPEVDIYIDSPMAVEATKIFVRNSAIFDDEAQALMEGKKAESLFVDNHIHYVMSVQESMEVNKIKKGAIILSASGMCEAGRIKHHLKHNLWRPESTVLFVGYQAQGTLGRRILEGESVVRIHGEEVTVKAEIMEILDFSAHADQKGLLNWLKGIDQRKPKHVFLVHGEDEAIQTLQEQIAKELGLATIIPCMGEEYDLQILKPEVTACVTTVPEGKVLAAEVDEAFDVIKNKVLSIARTPGQDRKVLEKLLAKIHEIEGDLARIQ